MLRNYFKISWRNLLKNRVFSLINILGLSFSVAFCLLLFFYIRYEQSFDSFHAKKDHLYRLEMTNLWKADNEKPKQHLFSFLTKNDDVENTIIFPLIVGTDLQNTFPEIKSITRIKNSNDHFGGLLIKAQNQVYNDNQILYADDNFFGNLSFKLKKGNPKTVLHSPKNIILSETVARKYFGNKEAIGKTIQVISDSNRLLTVEGIAADAPTNSSIQYGIIMPLQADPRYLMNIKERLNHSEHVFIVELADQVSVTAFEQKMDRWVKTYFTDYLKDFKDANINNFHLYLRPLADCHYNTVYEWGHYTDANSIYELACLVIVILLIASLNYVLLTVSNAASRSQEVGVRKIMGAKRKSIILLFWVETQIVVAFAVVFGLVLSRAFLPLFNSAIGTRLNFNNFSWKEILLASLILCLLLGVLAGYYPALLISKMKPASIVKSFQTFKINPRFSRVLVVFQYTACVILMVAAFVINRQMQFINNKDLGFDKDQILMVENPTWDPQFTTRVRDRLAAFSETEPSILEFSGMNGSLDGSGNQNGFQLNGEQKNRKTYDVDYNYFKMLGLTFVQGRPFSRSIGSDSIKRPRRIVVNETLFSMLGKKGKLNELNEDLDGIIIGVVKDYHFESLTKKIEPEEHRLADDFMVYFMFKIRPGEMQSAISRIQKEWKQITNNYPFEFTFMDQTIAKMYEADLRWQQTIQASCFFAILIACMGLFGLSAINVANRTKEIGIRKVLGADLKDIVLSLSKNFILLVSISILLAAPVAWWILNKWLEDFAYRTNISWWMILLVGCSSLAIAMVTVGFHAVKASLANPVNSLRSE